MNEIDSPMYLYPVDDSDENNNEFSYLVDKDTIKRFVSELCNLVHHPVAVIDYRTLHESAEPEKLESMVEYYPMRRTCSVFRKCAGDDYCKKCDFFHAKQMDLNPDMIKKNISRCIKNPLDFFYRAYKDDPPKMLEGFHRPVIEYHCPMLGYRELVFPLLYKDKVYGVIFAGQIMVYEKNDASTNTWIKNGFFEKNSPDALFAKFVTHYNEKAAEQDWLTSQTIRERIEQSDSTSKIYDDILGFVLPNQSRSDYFSKNFATEAEYKTFIESVCNEIEVIEQKIEEAYEARRKKVLSRLLSRITDIFFSEYELVHSHRFQSTHDLRAAELKSAWKALQVFVNKLIKKIDSLDIALLEDVVVFGDGQTLRIDDSGRKGVVFSVPENSSYKDESVKLSADSLKGISNHDNSLEKPNILRGLSNGLPKENLILIRCHNIAMLLHVNALQENRKLYEHLTSAIENELVRINSIVALCTANLLKEKFILTLRMYRHENAHISTRLMGTIDLYFGNNGQDLIAETEEKRQLICNDLRNTIQLSANIADNIGIITGSAIKPRELKKGSKRLDVVDMLYKWQQMFLDELENRNLEIMVFRGGYDSSTVGYSMSLKRIIYEITQNNDEYSEAPRSIMINARLFELLIYNLVDNAVKYAYRGTCIYLVWVKRSNYYELCVTSYGPEIKSGDSIYGLYVRGDKMPNPIRGEGLGLYVVKRIAEVLKIDVNHVCRKVSNYNIPLVPWYNKLVASGKSGRFDNDEPQSALVINAYPQTKITEETMTTKYLERRIYMETWRTVFTVRIPTEEL